jgi:N-acetylmuramoyl-L-alanine amidase
MRWIRSVSALSWGSFAPPDTRSISRRGRGGCRYAIWGAVRILALVLFSAFFLSGASPEKHLSVYSIAANYSLPLVQRESRDYVGLLELLEPLGKVSAKVDGSRWRLRYNSVQAEFQVNKSRARVQDRDADLGGKFLIENNRGLVPLGSLSSLLPRILGGPVSLHEVSDRLFIGSVGTHFTASLSGEETPKLIFRFSAPVNPMIATEPGTLRMTFSREPVVGPASPTLTFGSKVIPSATYSESNGLAVITVNAAVPVIATFGSEGRTLIISPVSTPSQSATGTASPTNTAPAQATPPTPPAAIPAVAPRRYFAVVDACHGGDDHGEALSTTLAEKDVTVVLARSLRQELESRGITTLVLRDSDANLSIDQRAVFTNADHAAIYIAVHASSSGHGVRVYTALLPYGEEDRGPFRSWTTAQHPALPLSQSTATVVASELQKRQLTVRTLSAALRPLNNVTRPAFAIEVAPQGSDISQLTAPDYQQLVTSAVATAIAGVRDQLGSAP